MSHIFTIISHAKMLSPRGLHYLTQSLIRQGANLSVLTSVGAKLYGERSALCDERGEISYRDLNESINQRAAHFAFDQQITHSMRIVVTADDSINSIITIFAISRLGANVYLVDSKIKSAQLDELVTRHRIDRVIDPNEVADCKSDHKTKLPRGGSAHLTVLTSGSTGVSKAASRRTSVGSLLPAFISLLVKLRLSEYRSLFIATPLHHGFGIAALTVALAVGSKSFMRRSFDAATTCRLIDENQIEAIALVPTILNRILDIPSADLRSLRCIITGGAPLSASLATRTLDRLGDVLFNLYGTSEGGVAILSSPTDMRRYPNSIGRPLLGVKARNCNGAKSEIEIRSKWSVGGEWTPTGDCGYSNEEGYWFLVGRVDDMIVSGGENVYPIELERIILSHEAVSETAVIGVADEDFGQRLLAFVVLTDSEKITCEELLKWLSINASRHMIPRQIIVVDELPYNAAGKIDRQKLAAIQK